MNWVALAPIGIFAALGGFFLAANMRDEAQTWVLNADGTWSRPDLSQVENPFNCHRFFMENPSLSGRGSAGASDVPKLTHTEEG